MTDNNGFSMSDAVLTSAMSGGFGGNRGGQWGGYGYDNGLGAGNSVLAAGAHADGTANSAKADCNAQRFSDGLNSISAQFNDQTRSAQFSDLNKSIVDQEFRNSDRLAALAKSAADTEFRSLDRQRDIEALLVQNAKDAAKCCCEAQLLAVQNACETQKLVTSEGTQTRELILAVEARSVVAALAVAQARINQLEIISALDKKA